MCVFELCVMCVCWYGCVCACVGMYVYALCVSQCVCDSGGAGIFLMFILYEIFVP